MQKAVEAAAGIQFRAEAVMDAVGALGVADFHRGAAKCSMASVLFEPLRVSFETVKQEVDFASGFAAPKGACAGASLDSALELFGLRWGAFRGTVQLPEVVPFAAAIVAQDLSRLKRDLRP
jgi:hypothetical protein